MNKHHISGLILTLLLSLSSPVLAGPTEDLASAIQQGKSLLAEQALLAGADPNVEVSLGGYVGSINVFLWAFKFKNTKLMELAVVKGADPNRKGQLDSGVKTALEYAIQNKQNDMISFLFSQGAKLNEAEMAALVQTGSTDEVAAMVKAHSPSDAAMSRGIGAALEQNHVATLKMLLKMFPLKKVAGKSLSGSLSTAIYMGYVESLQEVVPYVDWNSINLAGSLGCSEAGQEDHRAVAELLLKHWSKTPNAAGCFGEMFDGALKNGNPATAEKLFATLGTAGLPASMFNTWFMNAAEMGHGTSLQFLAKIYGKNKLTPTLLQASMEKSMGIYCHSETMTRCKHTWQWLLDQGLNINATNAKGQTFLIVATQMYDGQDHVRWLLSKGANPKLLDKKGRNALSYAKEIGNPEVIKLLQ